jgi:hypothetical protein
LKLAGIKEFGKKVDLKQAYANLSGKMQILLKSYSANFTRLLSDALQEDTLTHVTHFFIKGQAVVQCVLPFSTYVKKLANACAKITVMYSRIDANSIILAFNTLRSLIHWSQQKPLFDTVMKKMYNEFARESKIGGGGF